MWRQDLAILSPEGPRDNTCQSTIWCLAVSMLWCSLSVADLILGMEELELHYRCSGKSNFRKIIRRLFVTCDVFARYLSVAFPWLFHGFFVALVCLEKQVFGRFSWLFPWLFRGPYFRQILRVLALEKSSEIRIATMSVRCRNPGPSWVQDKPP